MAPVFRVLGYFAGYGVACLLLLVYAAWCFSLDASYARSLTVGALLTVVYVGLLVLQGQSHRAVVISAGEAKGHWRIRLLAFLHAMWRSAGVVVVAGAMSALWGGARFAVQESTALLIFWVPILTVPLGIYGWVLGARDARMATVGFVAALLLWYAIDPVSAKLVSHGAGYATGRTIRVILVDVLGNPLVVGLATGITIASLVRERSGKSGGGNGEEPEVRQSTP